MTASAPPATPVPATGTWQVSQRFYFEAAHTLARHIETEPSLRVHGHTYHVRFWVRGAPDPRTGMVIDVALLRAAADQVRGLLDHRLLDEVQGLDFPTLESLCAFIARALLSQGLAVSAVEVWREAAGDGCRLEI